MFLESIPLLDNKGNILGNCDVTDDSLLFADAMEDDADAMQDDADAMQDDDLLAASPGDPKESAQSAEKPSNVKGTGLWICGGIII